MGEVCNVFLHTHQLSAALYQHDRTAKELALFGCIFLAYFKPSFFRRSRKSQEIHSSSLKKCKARNIVHLVVQIISLINGWGLGSTGEIFIFAHFCLTCTIFSVMYCSCVFLHRSPSVIQNCGGGQEVEFSLFTASVNRTQLLKCNNP